jgi:uncharacterized protein (DUF58 family)
LHLAQRAYALILLTAVLAVAGIWSSQPGFAALWELPAALLLLGLAFESAMLRRTSIVAGIETAPRAFLGREQAATFTFRNDSARAITLEFAPLLPEGFDPLSDLRSVVAPPHGTGREPFNLLPIRLGTQSWQVLHARLLGALGLAWWSRDLDMSSQTLVLPDTLRAGRVHPRGNPSGSRARRVAGAGAELHQLRGYRYGDPLARIDWKATARTRRLVTREFSEDQHLDILVAIDAGRLSRIRVGALDRFGLYANIAARFAEIAIPNDDRVGLVVFADRALVACAPDRGLRAVTRVRQALEGLGAQAAESDPMTAAVKIRRTLQRRALVILLTDLDDANVADPLARAVGLLCPPHLVVVAGVRSPEIAALAMSEAREWREPWVALAAREHEERVALHRLQLRRRGAPVIAASAELLEKSLLAQYEMLRRSRQV